MNQSEQTMLLRDIVDKYGLPVCVHYKNWNHDFNFEVTELQGNVAIGKGIRKGAEKGPYKEDLLEKRYFSVIVSEIKSKSTQTLSNSNDVISTDPVLNAEADKKSEGDSTRISHCVQENGNIENDSAQLLLNKLHSFNFTGFHHYTDFQNFIRIMKSGYLYSRAGNPNFFIDGAEKAVIAITDEFILNRVRFYYRSATPTLKANEGIKANPEHDRIEAHMPIPVLLLFDESIIKHDDVYFSNGGCGSKKSLKTNDYNEAYNYDWFTVFSRNSPDPDAKYVNNCQNAEFLYPDRISIEYLKAIIFRCEADMKHAVFILGPNDKYKVDANEFVVRENYNKSLTSKRNFLKNYQAVQFYKDETNSQHIKFMLQLFNPPEGYKHEVVLFYQSIPRARLEITLQHDRDKWYTADIESQLKVDKIRYLLNGYISAEWSFK